MRVAKPKKRDLLGPYTVGKYSRDEAALRLKRPDGKWQLIQDVYPAMFVKPRDVEQLPENEYFIEARDETNRYSRVILNPHTTRVEVDDILNECHALDIWPMEADVDPIRRWFSDTGAEVTLETKALFFDLETWPLVRGFDDEAKKQHVIISYAASDTDGHFWFEYNETLDDAGEAKLILKFIETIRPYDTILAWNGKDYDFYVLRWRCRKLGIEVDWRDWNCLDYMLVVKKCLMSITDKSFKRSFALDNIGFNVLGIRKLELDIDKGRMDQLIRDKRVGELRAYNGRDTEIMIKLEQAREFLKLHLTVCRLCRKFPDNASIFSNVLGDGLMLRQAVVEDRHLRSRYSSPEEDSQIEETGKYVGGYVMDSKVGFHTDVQVVDFSSLYPSIMISYNMSQETKIRADWNYPSDVRENAARSPSNGILFRTDFEGMLPKVLRELLDTRKVYAGKQKNAPLGSDEWKRYGHESTAIKVVANSMYGLHGSQYTRYYDREIAESITLTAQYYIQHVIDYITDKMGYEIIHADTDSAFVKAPGEDMSRIVAEINNVLIPAISEECHCRVTTIKIDSDKGFHTLLMPTKKKYCGKLSTHKGRPAPDDMEPEIKGLEYVRSDVIPYAQRMQFHFLKLLIERNVDADIIERALRVWAINFMKELIPLKEIEMTQAVKKWPRDYKVQTPATRAAQMLIDAGKEFFVGMKVGYVVTSHNRETIKVIPSEMFDGNFDREYYWTNKIVGPTARLIRARFLDHDFALLKSLETSFSQQMLPFDERHEEMAMEKILPKNNPKQRRQARPKFPTVTLIINAKDDASENTVVGISKLAEVATGKYPLQIRIITKNSETTISTKARVGQDFLNEVTKLFPWVKVEW